MRLLTQRPAAQNSGATVAQVTFSETADFGAVRASEQRAIPVFAPRGVAYRPCEGDHLLLLSADGSSVCAGVLSAAQALEPGELHLASAGGARIHLKNNGDILLNGVTITAQGEILPPSAP